MMGAELPEWVNMDGGTTAPNISPLTDMLKMKIGQAREGNIKGADTGAMGKAGTGGMKAESL